MFDQHRTLKTLQAGNCMGQGTAWGRELHGPGNCMDQGTAWARELAMGGVCPVSAGESNVLHRTSNMMMIAVVIKCRSFSGKGDSGQSSQSQHTYLSLRD